jgi:hypothetical protein
LPEGDQAGLPHVAPVFVHCRLLVRQRDFVILRRGGAGRGAATV